jgi:hypothetical protein
MNTHQQFHLRAGVLPESNCLRQAQATVSSGNGCPAGEPVEPRVNDVATIRLWFTRA